MYESRYRSEVMGEVRGSGRPLLGKESAEEGVALKFDTAVPLFLLAQ